MMKYMKMFQRGHTLVVFWYASASTPNPLLPIHHYGLRSHRQFKERDMHDKNDWETDLPYG